MRKINAVLSALIIILFGIHGIAGAFQLFGVFGGGNSVLEIMSYILLSAICVHALIGVKLTFDTLSSMRKSGVSYFKENAWFWIRRISGFSVLLFAAWHVIIFTSSGGADFRLHDFGALQLAASILLAVSVVIHVVSNIKPLIISFGSGFLYKFIVDMFVVLSVVLLFCAAAFIFYYFRWNIFWR